MNKNLFKTKSSLAVTDAVNDAGAPAYSLNDEEALAQLVVTGCFNNTFYTKVEDQMAKVIELANKCRPEYVAKLAVYGRKKAFMKDSPAVLAALLSVKSPLLFKRIFPVVINNMKMVRNLVQVIRSGVVGRKSLGSAPKKAIQRFFANLTDEQLFMQSIGQTPSVVDIIKLAHIKSRTPTRDNFFKYLLGLKYDTKMLPEIVQQYEAFKADNTLPLPAVDWQMLSSFTLTDDHWIEIGKNMNWHALRMNLNTLERHGALKNKDLVKSVVAKLTDKETIKKINVFPYQLFATYLNTKDTSGVNSKITGAIQDALDISVENVPVLNDTTHLFICLDVSGSMSSPVTGHNGSASSKVKCVDVGAIFAASFAKTNQQCDVKVITFHNDAKEISLNLKDSLATLATSINTPGGGTNCNSAMELIKNHYNLSKTDKIAVVFVSDNCSWNEYSGYSAIGNNTPLAKTWRDVRNKVAAGKLVLIDIQPGTTTPNKTSNEVLNVGGFSDAVFDVVAKFINNSTSWAEVINNITIPNLASSPVSTSEEE